MSFLFRLFALTCRFLEFEIARKSDFELTCILLLVVLSLYLATQVAAYRQDKCKVYPECFVPKSFTPRAGDHGIPLSWIKHAEPRNWGDIKSYRYYGLSNTPYNGVTVNTYISVTPSDNYRKGRYALHIKNELVGLPKWKSWPSLVYNLVCHNTGKLITLKNKGKPVCQSTMYTNDPRVEIAAVYTFQDNSSN